MGRRGMIALPYFHGYTDRTGKWRQYFRRGNRRIPLPGIPGTAEFMAAYHTAEAQCLLLPSRPEPASGTLAALVARYYASGKFRNLSPSAKAGYKRTLDALVETHGARSARQMQAKHIEAILAKMTNGSAYYFLKRLRTMMRYAVKEKLIPADPTAGIDLNKIGEFHTWTDAELRMFEERWPVGTKQRLAYSLLLYTGQRISDACRLAWPDEDGFRVTQKKTGTHLVIPIHPTLAGVLAATRKRHVVLITEYERPFSSKGLGNLMSEAIRKAGLPEHCKAHGLRKAAARRLAEAGATEKQIMAITGHKTLAEVERYTRAADQTQLARAAMEKQAENDGVANRVTNRRRK